MLIAVFAAVAVAGAYAEDRTYNTLTSGLSQLINPGPQGPYSAPQPENTYGLPAEHQVWSLRLLFLSLLRDYHRINGVIDCRP